MFSTIKNLKGNPRACVYTEPLWGLSMNLCLPYLSVYMLALGLRDTQIGLIVAVNSLSQMIFSFLSGPITDKLGRRKTTAIFDLIAWSIPSLIWWRAENFWFFLMAALLNGNLALTANSWDCLLIEDAEKKQITKVYSIVVACAQFSAFFAPITSLLISRLTLVPAIRILFLNASILMTIKAVILYFASRETGIGERRIIETRGKGIFQLAGGYGGVLKMILRSKGMVFSIVTVVLVYIVATLNGAFWQVIVNKKLLIHESLLPLFLVLKSILAILFLFFIIPRLSKGILKIPLVMGFCSYLLGQGLLILVPVEGVIKIPLLCLSLAFDSFGFASLNTLSESLIALHANKNERARIMAIRYMFMMVALAPFGWLGGFLSDISRNLPFVMNLALLAAGLAITLLYYHRNADHSAEEHDSI